MAGFLNITERARLMVLETENRTWLTAGLLAVLLAAPVSLAQTAAPDAPTGESSSLLSLMREDAFRPGRPASEAPVRPSAMLAEDSDDAAEAPDPVAEEQAGIDKAFSFGVSYTVVSDYIFRGINFSEHATEGREKLNHQVTTSLGVDLAALGIGPFGSIHFDTFFEWYADQKKISGDGANIQEIDYLVYWSYDIEQIGTSMSIGWTRYDFPNATAFDTDEWFISLEHNDAWMWKWLFPDNEDGVLNPSFFLAHDFDIASGVWMEVAISHDFVCPQIPHLTMTPGLKLGIDAGWAGPLTGADGHDTRLAFLEYNVSVAYALSEALGLPDAYGDISLSTFLAFSDAFAEGGSAGIFRDEFYGGFGISWDW